LFFATRLVRYSTNSVVPAKLIYRLWNTSLNHLLASSLVPRLLGEGEGLSDFEASPSG
jgi:hypothetical protein